MFYIQATLWPYCLSLPNHHAGTLTGIVDFGVDRSCSRMQYPWREAYGLRDEVTFLFGLYTNFDCHSNLMRPVFEWHYHG